MLKIKIHKYGLMETMVYLMFLLLPFTLFLNTILFRNIRIGGIGILNLLFDIILVIAFLDAVIHSQKYNKTGHVYIFMFCFAILHMFKFLQSDDSINNFILWFPLNQYYYLLPLVLILLKNRKLDMHNLVLNIIAGSWVICPLSIYMFLTNNYFGMVSNENFLIYDIVNLPYARMFSVFGSPLVAGPYFALIIIIIYYEYGLKPFWTKMLIAINLLCLILTFSKTSFVALIAVMLYKYLFDGKIRYWNKIFKILILLSAVALCIMYISNKNIYFWNVTEIFQNIRFVKWAAALKAIRKIWFIGSDFSTHIFTINSWETTLSDNSFLISIAYYGILFWLIIGTYEIIRFARKANTEIRQVIPAIIMSGILMFFYDFIQVYPANYIMIAVYIFLERKYIDMENMAMQSLT